MKKLIILPLLIVCIGVFAQNNNGATFVASIAIPGDHFWLPKGAREIAPIIIVPPNGSIDSLRSIDYSYTIKRDSSQALVIQAIINFYNRSGTYVNSNILNFSNSQFTSVVRGALLNKVDAVITATRPKILLQ